MRLGRMYAKRTKLGPSIGRTSVDPDSNGWIVYWYAAGGRWWKFWPLHAGRVLALKKATPTNPPTDTGRKEVGK